MNYIWQELNKGNKWASKWGRRFVLEEYNSLKECWFLSLLWIRVNLFGPLLYIAFKIKYSFIACYHEGQTVAEFKLTFDNYCHNTVTAWETHNLKYHNKEEKILTIP